MIKWAQLPRNPLCLLSEDGRWSISKSMVNGAPRYALWDRRNRQDTGFYAASLEDAMRAAEDRA